MLSSLVLAFALAATLVASAPTLRARQTSTGQSGLFNLIVESSNSTLNGSQLFAGHAGAAIEDLIVGNQTITQSASTQFNFNVSASSVNKYENVTGSLGNVVWTLPALPRSVSEPLSFTFNPSFDTAIVQFEPTTGTTFGFKDDYLVYPEYTDDDKTPVIALERWYTCTIPINQGQGYGYFALLWGLGSKVSDNETCQSVRVKRVFV